MNINLREPSTKRGIVMVITGGVVLYQSFVSFGPTTMDVVVGSLMGWSP